METFRIDQPLPGSAIEVDWNSEDWLQMAVDHHDRQKKPWKNESAGRICHDIVKELNWRFETDFDRHWIASRLHDHFTVNEIYTTSTARKAKIIDDYFRVSEVPIAIIVVGEKREKLVANQQRANEMRASGEHLADGRVPEGVRNDGSNEGPSGASTIATVASSSGTRPAKKPKIDAGRAWYVGKRMIDLARARYTNPPTNDVEKAGNFCLQLASEIMPSAEPKLRAWLASQIYDALSVEGHFGGMVKIAGHPSYHFRKEVWWNKENKDKMERPEWLPWADDLPAEVRSLVRLIEGPEDLMNE